MTYMLPADLRYGQKITVAYTGIDGLEKVRFVEAHWLKQISRRRLKKLAFKKTFPFVGINTTEFTDVLMNSGSDILPEWKHIYALESPKLMAKKFGIEYQDVDIALIEDDLETI